MIVDVSNIHNWLSVAGLKFGDDSKIEMYFSLCEEEISELKLAIDQRNIQEIIDAIIDLNWVANNCTFGMGITPEEIEKYNRLVSISNWSKFCTKEKDAIDTVEAYRAGTHTDKIGVRINSYYEKVGDYYVIKRHDGKVLKSLFYKNVTQLLKENDR